MKILYLGNRNKHETAWHPQFSHTTAQALPYLSSTAQTQPQNAVRPPNFAFICHKKKQNHNHCTRNRNPSHRIRPLMGYPSPVADFSKIFKKINADLVLLNWYSSISYLQLLIFAVSNSGFILALLWYEAVH